MGLLRTLIGSSSSSKQTPPPPSSPFENDTDDLPTNESSTSTSASNPLPLLRSNDTGSSLIDPETGLEMDTPYSQSQSPSLDRVRTIRQADYLPSPKNSLEVEDSAERSRGPEKVLGSPMDQGKAEGNDGTGVGGNRTPSGNAATGGSRFGIGTITKRGRKRSSDLSSSPSSNETTTSDRTHPENQIDPLQRSSLPPLQSSSSPPTTLPQTQSNPLPPPITTSTLSPLDYSSSSTSPSGRSTEQARILSDKRSRRSSQEEDPRRAVSKTNEGEAGVGSSSSGSGIGDEARTHHVRGEGSNGGERGMTRNHDDDGGYGYRSGLVQGQGEDYRIGNGNGVGLNIRGMGMRSAMEGGGGLRVRAGSGNRNGCGDEDDEGHGKDLPHRDYGKNIPSSDFKSGRGEIERNGVPRLPSPPAMGGSSPSLSNGTTPKQDLTQQRPFTQRSISSKSASSQHSRRESADLPPLPTNSQDVDVRQGFGSMRKGKEERWFEEKELPPPPVGEKDWVVFDSAGFSPVKTVRRGVGGLKAAEGEAEEVSPSLALGSSTKRTPTMMMMPDSIVITPSSPAKLSSSSGSPALNGTFDATRSLVDSEQAGLGRAGALRMSMTEKSALDQKGRRLRHVRSLGFGVPSTSLAKTDATAIEGNREKKPTASNMMGGGDRSALSPVLTTASGPRTATSSDGEEILASATSGNGSTISLGSTSGLSVSFGAGGNLEREKLELERERERKTSTGTTSSTGGGGGGRNRSPSPMAAMLGRMGMRGVSTPLIASASGRKSNGGEMDTERGEDTREQMSSRSAGLRKVKSFSSFFGVGGTERPSYQDGHRLESTSDNRASPLTDRLSAESSSMAENPKTSLSSSVSEQIADKGGALLADGSVLKKPSRSKLLRGPSSWFSGLRKSGQRDKLPASPSENEMEMQGFPQSSGSEAGPDWTPLAATPTASTPTMSTASDPMEIPSPRKETFQIPKAPWMKAFSASPLLDPTAFDREAQNMHVPEPGQSSPGIAVSPRTGSLGYFPSISEYSSTSSRIVSAVNTPALTPLGGVPDIITSSSSSSLRGKGSSALEQSAMPREPLVSPKTLDMAKDSTPDLQAKPSEPIVFKRPKTPERKRSQNDSPDLTARASSLESHNFDQDFGRLIIEGRPSLGQRSNSSSSLAAIERVKGVVTKSNGRARASSLLRSTNAYLGSPKQSSSMRESPASPTESNMSIGSTFASRHDRTDSASQADSAPSSRRSSFLWHPGRSRASSTADSTVLPVLKERGPLTGPEAESPNVVFSSPKTSMDGADSDRITGKEDITASKKRRPRASTLFTTRPPSPSRPKSSGSLFPPPPKTSRRMSSNIFRSGNESPDSASPAASGTVTPNAPPPKPPPTLPDKKDGDEPAEWLERLMEVVERAEVANVLASKSDPFFGAALELFMETFDFTNDALDISLRKLLMVASLPRETQQIDRVMDAFAKRYNACHKFPLFIDPDHAYVIAFSMIMLHTDAFNKNNKRKMTKEDYVRNTRLPGVSPLMLETFYDNTCYTAFQFIDDGDGSRLFMGQGRERSASSARSSKLDIYALLKSGKMKSLQVEVLSKMSLVDPVSYYGSRPFFDFGAVRQAFEKAPSMEVSKPATRRSSGSKLMVGGSTNSPSLGREGAIVGLKIVKVGLLSRKDDLAEGSGKASNRKWRSWSVLLTTSQLIFLREPTWGLALLDRIAAQTDCDGTDLLLPRQTDFRPEEVVTLSSAYAVYDPSSVKYPNAFRLIMPQGRQFILQSADEFEMNEWIAAINWASTYKTSGIAMPHVAAKNSTSVSVDTLTPAMPFAAVMAEKGPSEENLKSDGFDHATIEAALNQGRHSPRNSQGDEEIVTPSNVGSPEKELGSLSRLIPRAEAICIKIAEYRNRYIPLEKQIEEELRIARSLDLLVPFDKSTRDKIEGSIPLMAAKVHRLRIQLASYRCWIGILEGDLAESGIKNVTSSPNKDNGV